MEIFSHWKDGKELDDDATISTTRPKKNSNVLGKISNVLGKISNVFRKISNVLGKISNVFRKISNVFGEESTLCFLHSTRA